MKRKIRNHFILWLFGITLLSLVYAINLPSVTVAFAAAMMVLPVHVFYYYTVANWIIPIYLQKKNFIQLILTIFCCGLFSALLLRLIEIQFVDPYIFSKIKVINPHFMWVKLSGSFTDQLFHPVYYFNAVVQSNFLIWFAIAIKYLKLWLEKRQVNTQSELDFLKAKLHPHFLFNTLNNLYALTLSQSKESPNIVLGLSNILRYMLYECNSSSVLLKRDIEILESYVALERIRYENRLDLTLSIVGLIKDQRIPPLLMFPLLENAFKEGSSEMIGEPWISINLEVNDHKLKFKVSNSKPAQKVFDTENSFAKKGLKNLMKRMEMQFSEGYNLQIFEEEELSVVILQLDLNKHK